MRCVEIAGRFGIGALRVCERPDPTPGQGEVVVRLRAAALNHRDLMMVNGTYNPKQSLPLIPCSDGAGIVESVGAGVQHWHPGDRVIACFSPHYASGAPTPEKLRRTLGGPLDGTLAERIVLPATGVVPAPLGMSDAACATLPCAALTAWNALVEEGQIAAGDTVVVQGTGGVSLFALQIARLHGARVIVTSSSDAKLEKARAMGAWQTLNYKQDPEWGKTVKKLTDARGADIVVEVGGAGTLEQSLKAVRLGGRVMVIGVLSGGTAELALRSLLMTQVRLQGVFVGHREMFERMLRAFVSGGIEPVIDCEFGLGEARAAFEYLASGAHLGKVVVDLNSPAG